MQANEAENIKDLDLLKAVCREAAKLGMQYFGKNPEVWIKQGNSPVSEADLAIDTLLKEKLLSARPDYGWISEETEDTRETRSYQRYFVVDPIDGTRGFLNGSAYWCISVAVVENGRPVVGILHCPVSGDVYHAILGSGAYLNGQKLPKLAKDQHFSIVSATKSMENKIKENMKMADQTAQEDKISQKIVEQLVFLSYIPSLACRIALVAKGEIDLVLVRPNCNDWDIAAADLIVHEAGGCLLDLQQNPVHYGKPPFAHEFLFASDKSQINNVIDIVEKANLV